MMASNRCAFCHRVTEKPAAWIGGIFPVGPTCAKQHNLGAAIRMGRGAIRAASAKPVASMAERDPRTRDLFEGVAA